VYILIKYSTFTQKTASLKLTSNKLFPNHVPTLAVVVYGTPLSNPLPRAANHRAHPMLSSSTVVSGRISCAMFAALNYMQTNTYATVINSIPSIWHRFQITADYMSSFRYRHRSASL